LSIGQEECINILEDIFENAANNPKSWFDTAVNLKLAANELYSDDFYKPIPVDKNTPFIMPIYRMLLGLSFENLLKGLLVASREQIITPDGEFTVHDMKRLLDALDDTGALPTLTDEERNLLCELESYVVWLGRYPVPEKTVEYTFSRYSNADHFTEQELWEKISEHLSDRI
jgi:hypothetical protein